MSAQKPPKAPPQAPPPVQPPAPVLGREFTGGSSGSSSSSSTTYDWSGQDMIDKLNMAAAEAESQKQKDLYDGNVSGSLSGGQRIRLLKQQASQIQPVRIHSVGTDRSSNSHSPGYKEEYGLPPEPLSAVPQNKPAAGNNQKPGKP